MKARRGGLCAVLIIAALFFSGCSRDSGSGVPVAQEDEAKGEGEAAPPKKESMKEKMKKARIRPIAIGGCQEACSDHKEAFEGYLRALMDENGAADAVSFLETSEMIYNGQRLGLEWVELWKDGKQEERSQSIAAFSAKIGAWATSVEPEKVELAMGTGITYGEDDSPGFLVYFRHPHHPNSTSAPIWRYRIQARGWEWLISEVRTENVE